MTPTTWIAAFERREGLHWFSRFLAPRYAHCFAFGYVVEKDQYVYVEGTTSGVLVGIATREQVETWFRLACNRDLRLLEMAPRRVEVVRARWFVSCAGVVASLYGLRRYPLTPYGLFKMLRRAGAREICGEVSQ